MLDSQTMLPLRLELWALLSHWRAKLVVRGITVNAIAPGFIKTDMTDALPDEQKEALASQIPLDSVGYG